MTFLHYNKAPGALPTQYTAEYAAPLANLPVIYEVEPINVDGPGFYFDYDGKCPLWHGVGPGYFSLRDAIESVESKLLDLLLKSPDPTTWVTERLPDYPRGRECHRTYYLGREITIELGVDEPGIYRVAFDGKLVPIDMVQATGLESCKNWVRRHFTMVALSTLIRTGALTVPSKVLPDQDQP